jgi:GMP synthase (glutamine-hydrolysing)
MTILIVNNNSKNSIGKTTRKLIEIIEDVIIISSVSELNVAIQNKDKIKGIVLSGGSLLLSEKICMYDTSLNISILLYFPNIPILGICYGMQIMAIEYGGKVSRLKNPKMGIIGSTCHNNSTLFKGINNKFNTFQLHSDYVSSVPINFKITAMSNDNIVYGFESIELKRWGVQFHPECLDETKQIIHNFLSFCK